MSSIEPRLYLTTRMIMDFAQGKAPLTWPDFWDAKKFPGPRGYYNAPTYSLEFALIADGVPKDKLYPIDVPRALKSLDRVKPDEVTRTAGPPGERSA